VWASVVMVNNLAAHADFVKNCVHRDLGRGAVLPSKMRALLSIARDVPSSLLLSQQAFPEGGEIINRTRKEKKKAMVTPGRTPQPLGIWRHRRSYFYERKREHKWTFAHSIQRKGENDQSGSERCWVSASKEKVVRPRSGEPVRPRAKPGSHSCPQKGDRNVILAV